jgi:predicted transglutaminase-like cysteine proteinase
MPGRCCFALFFVLTLALRAQEADALEPVVETSPTLAPFQHVRFCIRYPRDCQPSSSNNERIRPQIMGLLKGINDKVNQSIKPRPKSYDEGPFEGWRIAPDMGDCNDYAVTKRHELLLRGLPSSGLRLSVAKTPEGVGHLVLVVTTTDGNVVMDNLTDKILPWQSTDYQWIKIQSISNPRLWVGIKRPLASELGRPAKNGPG